MDTFVVVTTLLLIGIGVWQVRIMKAQQNPVDGVSAGRFLWLKRYWPILVMFLILLLNWTPWLLHKNDEIVHFQKTGIEHLKVVYGKHFVKEKVNIDGINFSNCKFEDVTLIFEGTDTVAFTNSSLYNIRVETSSDAVSTTIALLKALGQFKPGIPILDKDEKPLPEMKGAEQIH